MAERRLNTQTMSWEWQPSPPEVSYICGLDLGQVSDFTALCVIEKTVTEADGKTHKKYGVRHLQRWLGRSYVDIAEELRPMLAMMDRPVLVPDATGVGVGVVDILRKASLPIRQLVPVVITGGHSVSKGTRGGWNVPKRELVAVTQSALQGDRLIISPKLQEAATLRKELSTFKSKISLAGNESLAAWREKDHDDLVLSCCMAVWFGENFGRKAKVFFGDELGY
jgi:hypothetical protein